MIYAVKLTNSAKNDLITIGQFYLSKAGITVAKQLIDTIEAAIKTLSQMPERGHKPHELYQVANSTIFEIIKSHYRIIYKLMPEEVTVLAIFDGRQDVKNHLTKRLTTLN